MNSINAVGTVKQEKCIKKGHVTELNDIFRQWNIKRFIHVVFYFIEVIIRASKELR